MALTLTQDDINAIATAVATRLLAFPSNPIYTDSDGYVIASVILLNGVAQQHVRDAMLLAVSESAPAAAAGSIDAQLAAIAATGSGTGAGTYSDTVADGQSTPLDGVLVQLSTDAAGLYRVYQTRTSAAGVFTLHPDPGTYYLWLELAGYQFTQGAAVTVV